MCSQPTVFVNQYLLVDGDLQSVIICVKIILNLRGGATLGKVVVVLHLRLGGHPEEQKARLRAYRDALASQRAEALAVARLNGFPSPRRPARSARRV